MENIIIIAILFIVVGYAVFYIWKSKRNGNKCIGCPSSGCKSCKCGCDGTAK